MSLMESVKVDLLIMTFIKVTTLFDNDIFSNFKISFDYTFKKLHCRKLLNNDTCKKCQGHLY